MNTEGLIFNFLGDSITYGYGTSGNDKIYLNLLKEDLALKEANNYGIGGTRYGNYIGKDIYAKVPEARPFGERYKTMKDGADAVVVFGGTNDYGTGNIPWGERNDCSMDTFLGSVNYLLKGLKEKYPSAVLLILTPVHRIKETVTANAVTGKYLPDYAREICCAAKRFGAVTVDLFFAEDVPSQEEFNRRYLFDGLHPNDAGHRWIAEKIKRVLEGI
ncbi:MAG: SGNH/GDSL hydrolase family protein [Candidatus Scatosoma sp.]